MKDHHKRKSSGDRGALAHCPESEQDPPPGVLVEKEKYLLSASDNEVDILLSREQDSDEFICTSACHPTHEVERVY